MEDEEYEYEEYKYESKIDKWNRENNTSLSCGTCPRCGSKIYQTTYTDFCECGEQDYAY
jgi:hypothetical protein